MEKMKETFRRLRFGSDPSYEKRISSMIDLTTSSTSSQTQGTRRLNNNVDENKFLHLDNVTSSKITASSPNLLVPGKGCFIIRHLLYKDTDH